MITPGPEGRFPRRLPPAVLPPFHDVPALLARDPTATTKYPHCAESRFFPVREAGFRPPLFRPQNGSPPSRPPPQDEGLAPARRIGPPLPLCPRRETARNYTSRGPRPPPCAHSRARKLSSCPSPISTPLSHPRPRLGILPHDPILVFRPLEQPLFLFPGWGI